MPIQLKNARKWRIWIAAWLALTLVSACLVFWPRSKGFEVNGVPFRIWVAQRPDFLIEDSLATIGTNAIPHFVELLHERDESARVFQIRKWIWDHLPKRLQLRFYAWYPVPRWQLKRTALFGLRLFGAEAKLALPDVLRVGQSETNKMVQASALTAALAIAPEAPHVFAFWREEWERQNFSRRDLAIYLRSARYPITAAAPLLLAEAQSATNPITVLEAFEFLGEAARPAVPPMIEMLHNGTYSGNILEILMRLGPVASEAVPAVSAHLDVEKPSGGVLQVLKAIGPEARAALPKIQPLLTNRDLTIRMLAASASAHIQNKPELALPVLLDVLEKPLEKTKWFIKVDIRQPSAGYATAGPEAAAILLGESGPAAADGLPALERKLQDKNPHVRVASAQAIWRISGSAEKALPVLREILDSQPTPVKNSPFAPDNHTLIRAIEALEEIGPAAKDAIPSLLRVRTFSMTSRRAVNSALAHIATTK